MKLELGYNHPFAIRSYHLLSEKFSGTRILYLSDFHFNRFGGRSAAHIAREVREINPDIILLGGDYADSKKGLYHFARMVESIAHCKHMLAIPGNHDRFSKWHVRRIIEGANGVWLDKASVVVKTANLNIRIDGGRAANRSTNPTVKRSGAADLSILCLHKPIDVSTIAHDYDLIFAGHLHGSQVVLWSTGHGLYPGRLLYKWNRLSASFGNCHYLISKGLGDTLPIRYNCRKDFLCVTLMSTLPFQNKT
jgi:uncharacterized protein